MAARYMNVHHANTWMATQTFQTNGATVPIIVKAAPNQTVDLQQWKDAQGNVVSRVTSTGQLEIAVTSGVISVTNPDGTLIIAPTTGDVEAILNLTNPNTWTGTQTFQSPCVLATNMGQPTGPAAEGTCVVDPAFKKMWVYMGGDWRESSFFGEPVLCQGRLTLVSGVPVPTSNIVGASTLYFTAFDGNRISMYDGKAWLSYQFSEISLNLAGLTPGLPYDVFAYYNSGLFLSLNAWSDANSRSGDLTLQDGIYVKALDPTYRFLGTIYPTSATTTEDSDARRFVNNYYNRRIRRLLISDPGSHNYNSPAWRPYNDVLANRVEFVIAMQEEAIDGGMFCQLNGNGYVGVNVDATDGSGTLVQCAGNAGNAVIWAGSSPTYFPPSPGYHFFQAMEYSGGGPASVFTGMVLNATIEG